MGKVLPVKQSRNRSHNFLKRIKRLESLLKSEQVRRIPSKNADVDSDTSRSDSRPVISSAESLPDLPVRREMQVQDLQEPISDPEDLLPLANLVPEFSETNEEVLQCLGDDPSKPVNNQLNFHPELVSRWNTWLSQGISTELKNTLLEKYPLQGNCNLEPPKLNPEIISSLSDTAKKRDSHFVDTQHLLGVAMAPLGLVISELLQNKEEGVDRLEILEKLCDTAKVLAEVYHSQSVARKAYISPGIDKNVQKILDSNTIGTHLFGENLTQKIDEAKAIQKASFALKPNLTEKYTTSNTNKKYQNQNNRKLNWKSPPVRYTNHQQVGNRPQFQARQPRTRGARPTPYPRSQHNRYQQQQIRRN